MTDFFSERVRRIGAMACQWLGWLGAFGLLIWSAQYDPRHGQFVPSWIGFAFVFLVGIAIAGGMARTRMRITATVLSAMRAGRDTERNHAKGIADNLEARRIDTAAKLERERQERDG